MFILYNIIFFIVSIIYLPIYLLRRKFHSGFWQRLGFLPKDLELNRPIWIHAVSVGEVMAIRELVDGLRLTYPNKNLVISTVTATGNKIAKNITKERDFVIYLPLDFSFIIRKVIDKINPSLFIIAETEIWPNLISYLYKKNIPVIVLNGRISDKSFKGYLIIKFLLKSLLNKISMFCVQTNRDCQRLIALGVLSTKIKVTGNMKFDTTDYTDKKIMDYTDYRQKLGLVSDNRLLVAGSTHPGEEKIILNIYKELLIKISSLRLLIAPRHPERSKEIEKIAIKYGFNPQRISQLTIPSAAEGQANKGQTIFILDTIGQLMNYYAIADIVFVGGSLVKKGGHNILEPAVLGKPILFGPDMFNFSDIADLFIAAKAALLVYNQEELKVKIKELLIDKTLALNLGQKAKELISKNRGSTERNINLIKGML